MRDIVLVQECFHGIGGTIFKGFAIDRLAAPSVLSQKLFSLSEAMTGAWIGQAIFFFAQWVWNWNTGAHGVNKIPYVVLNLRWGVDGWHYSDTQSQILESSWEFTALSVFRENTVVLLQVLYASVNTEIWSFMECKGLFCSPFQFGANLGIFTSVFFPS